MRPLFLVATLSLAGWAAALLAETRVEQPFTGITHIIRSEDFPRPVNMHIVKIDLTAPGLAFIVTAPGGTRETVRQTTLEFLEEEEAQVAINGHFFLPFPSRDSDANLIGLAASDGNVYSAFEEPAQSYAIVSNAPALNIDRFNHTSIVHHDDRDVELWNTVAGSAQIVTDGIKTIPVYADEQNPQGLLLPGGPLSYSNSYSWYAVANARTAIGITEDNQTLILFTVDRAGGSEGMTLAEVADVLISDYGVYNALNLDGGGSATMAMEDPVTHERTVVNKPSGSRAERAVGSNLAVFAIPVQ